MNETFEPDEKLYRAVLPNNPPTIFWKEDGSLSSAAFKDRNGLSVDRGDYRDDFEVVNEMKVRGLHGRVICVTVEDCHSVNAIVKYLPVKDDKILPDNKYHSEIHKDLTVAQLTKSQCKRLAGLAKVIQ